MKYMVINLSPVTWNLLEEMEVDNFFKYYPFYVVLHTFSNNKMQKRY